TVTANLSGTISDANEAAIAGAQVMVTNNATGLKRQATTGSSGSFTIPLLPPGAYTVTVENQGFTTAEIREVVLKVGDNVGLELQLKVGQVGVATEVQDEAPLINESPAVGTVIDRKFVESIPLNGRSFQSLLLLTPGAVVLPTNYPQQGQFSVNGQRGDTNY